MRMPYGDDEVAALLQAAHDPLDAVLVLLGAHAGLRAHVPECADTACAMCRHAWVTFVMRKS